MSEIGWLLARSDLSLLSFLADGCETRIFMVSLLIQRSFPDQEDLVRLGQGVFNIVESPPECHYLYIM